MKRYAPATARNSAAIADVLKGELPESGMVLEVASGTGEHAVFLARRFPMLRWQPSDTDPEALQSIASWSEEQQAQNLLPPLQLDTARAEWPVENADAILCVNMVHISPWSATTGLFAGAGRVLPTGGAMIIYGPFLEAGTDTAPSNLSFDASLKSRNADWGLRDIMALDQLAQQTGLARTARQMMPANNLTLIYRRS